MLWGETIKALCTCVFNIEVAVFEGALVLSKEDVFALYKLGKCPTVWLDSYWDYVAKIQSICSMFGSALKMIGSYYNFQILVIDLDPL